MAQLTPKQIEELNIASTRIAAGTPGAPTADNAGDIANVEFAKKNLGFVFNPPDADISPIEDAQQIVGGSDRLRDDETVIKTDANELLADLGDTNLKDQLDVLTDKSLFSESKEGQEFQSELDTLRQGLGIFSTAEEQEVSGAGAAAAARFAPLIGEAEEAKRKGLPKAVIGAGERGGFLSTQFSGVAALQAVESGDFIGAGGRLEDIESVFDRNISNLKAQSQAAQLAAESASRKAIRTGKREDLNLANDAFDRAQQLSKDAITLANQKVTATSAFLTQQRTGVTFAQGQEDRLKTQASDQLNLLLEEGDETTIENNREAIKDLLVQAGFEDIEVNSLIDSFKEKAKQAALENLPKPELRTIGGALYSVEFDKETEQFETKLLIAKPPTGGTPPSTKITDSERISGIKDFLDEQNLAGEDQKVSWETYLAMKQTWINNKGSDSTFKLNFPIGQWMDADNIKEFNLRIKGE